MKYTIDCTRELYYINAHKEVCNTKLRCGYIIEILL